MGDSYPFAVSVAGPTPVPICPSDSNVPCRCEYCECKKLADSTKGVCDDVGMAVDTRTLSFILMSNPGRHRFVWGQLATS